MTENQRVFSEAGRIELTSTQRQVIEILRTAKSPKYPLGNWYLGAIYAAKNTYNPDRFSQAAQSLRELLEKLTRVFVESEVQESKSDFKGMRGNLYSRLCSDKSRYEGEWDGKTIDAELDKTIRCVDRYLELNQIPTRKEQIHSVMNKLDPMHDALDQGIRTEKSERFYALWKSFEGLAHHNTSADEDFFWQQLALAERLIIDLLAPITAQDQSTIKAIISKQQPEPSDVEKLIELVKRRGANYAFFFNTVDSPAWINPLAENGFFKNPPSVEAAGDDRFIAPLWWPIFYLKKVSAQSPEQVVEIVLGLEKSDNPRILREIFSIACDLPDLAHSLRLKPLIKRFLQSPYRWGEAELIVNILQRWGSEPGPSRNAAHEIIQYVTHFQADPKETEKRSRRKENPEAWSTSLEPAPRFRQWEYQQILEKGVRPLAEIEPYQVARILIDATASMIRMRTHSEDRDQGRDEDYSETWCRRLDGPDRNHQDPKRNLVHTLTYACEQVYSKAPESIEALDQALRSQRWKVFKRLRQQLYASHPNDQTLPWIRELILGHDDYSKWEHHYEFQLMIRKASEHFGPRLLSEGERSAIFNAILSGPSEESFRERMGERYSDEAFQQRQRYFHRIQLRPFAALLGGEYRRYFGELESEAQAEAVTDDSYSPDKGVSGWVAQQSPKSAEDLENFTDEELLTYLNDWNEEHRDKDNWLIEINISALAGVFQSLFKERIVPDGARLAFWMAHRDRIARPIYVAAMIKAMQELVKDKDFANLDRWIEFCSWILSHTVSDQVEDQPEPTDESTDNPSWGSSRRAVVDFVEACLNEDVDAPIAARDGLANLLQYACTQFDWRLDCDQPVLLNRDDPITEAINNTRSRALESLINFGFWIRRHLPEDPVREVTDILSKRMAEDVEFPLTRPEHALLGMHFVNLCTLNLDWATEYKTTLFPQKNEPAWHDAFASFIRFTRPSKSTFDILRKDFEFALEHLTAMEATEDSGKELVDTLGHHLFTYYYLWQVYPLTGDESLLHRFYMKTTDDRQRWANLFDYVGHSLSNSGKYLEKGLVDRAVAYFNWRLDAAEPIELQDFTFWLEAECLEPEWRLRSYSKILDLGRGKDVGLSMEVSALNELLPDNLSLVVECFAKITDAMDQGAHMYVSADEAKPILRAGLNAVEPQVRENAERARENLLRIGRFDFLDME